MLKTNYNFILFSKHYKYIGIYIVIVINTIYKINIFIYLLMYYFYHIDLTAV